MAVPGLSDHLDHLPMFPLPQALLFPSARMPLHIFEPRYLKMVRDARSGALPIAIGHIRASSTASTVEVHPVVGAGFIDQLEELPDGRFLIELQGAGRVRILEEREVDLPYRVVRAELVPDVEPPESEQRQRVDAVRRLILAIHRAQPDVGRALSSATEGRTTAAEIADALASALLIDAEVRQGWLEETNPAKRLYAVEETLEAFLVQARQVPSAMN